MLKLVITNGWSDLNAGDSAIIMSVIKRFQLEYGNEMEVSILSELNYENIFYSDSIDKIREVFPNININLISSPFFKVYDNKKINRIKEVVSLVKNISQLTFLGKNYNGKNEYYNAIKEADIIVSKGGHFIHDRRGINSIVHLVKCLYPIIISSKFSKDYFFIAQSFGPFFYDTILSKINTNIVRYYLNKAKGISVREAISYEAMKEIGIDTSIMNKTSDYAFLINEIKYDCRDVKKIQSKYMVITLRQHYFKTNDGEKQYLNNMKKLCEYVYSKYNIKSLIVPHVKGPNDFENDIIITNKFEKMISENNKNNYIFNYEYLHAKELVTLYSNAEILIGTRFHSVIFALAQGIPSLAISYSGYKANIMRQFEMDEFMINIDDINDKNFEKIKKLVDELIINNNSFRQKINTKLQEVIRSIMKDEAFRKIKEIIRN